MRSFVSLDSSEGWSFWRSNRIFSSQCTLVCALDRNDRLLSLIEGLSDVFPIVAIYVDARFLSGLSCCTCRAVSTIESVHASVLSRKYVTFGIDKLLCKIYDLMKTQYCPNYIFVL